MSSSAHPLRFHHPHKTSARGSYEPTVVARVDHLRIINGAKTPEILPPREGQNHPDGRPRHLVHNPENEVTSQNTKGPLPIEAQTPSQHHPRSARFTKSSEITHPSLRANLQHHTRCHASLLLLPSPACVLRKYGGEGRIHTFVDQESLNTFCEPRQLQVGLSGV